MRHGPARRDIDTHDFTAAHQVKDICEKVGRPTQTGARFHDQLRFQSSDHLLHHPGVQRILPDRAIEPADSFDVIGLGDNRFEYSFGGPLIKVARPSALSTRTKPAAKSPADSINNSVNHRPMTLFVLLILIEDRKLIDFLYLFVNSFSIHQTEPRRVWN